MRQRKNLKTPSPMSYSMIDSFILVITEWLNDYNQNVEFRKQQYFQTPIWSYEALNLLKLIENLIGSKEKSKNPENTLVISPHSTAHRKQPNVNIWRNDFKLVSDVSHHSSTQLKQAKHQWKSSLFDDSTTTTQG